MIVILYFNIQFNIFKRGGKYATGNPCPLCRDEFLVVDYKV